MTTALADADPIPVAPSATAVPSTTGPVAASACRPSAGDHASLDRRVPSL